MSSLEAEEFIKKMGVGDSVLALDVGAKTIGLSVGSLTLRIATPVTTIKRTKFKLDAQSLKKAIDEYAVKGLVVGYPFEMDGTQGRRCQSVRDFMMELEKHIECPPYAYHDERLSTASVDNLVDGFVKKRKAKDRGLTDKLAAQVILQSFFDQYLMFSVH